MTEHHRLQEWIAAADREIQDNYAENHAKARDPKRIQQTGHSAEHAWGQMLGRWLPPQYEIAYRRYILPEVDVDKYQPRETDIVVLRPGYPRALRDREEVLAAGVAMAFSVKLTLDGRGLADTIAEAAMVRRHLAPRLGTPRSELTQPLRYGVLGHSHSFGADSHGRIRTKYEAEDITQARHPRESLDIICIADLGVWTKFTMTWRPVWNEEKLAGKLVADHYSVTTSLMEHSTSLSNPERAVGLGTNQLSPLTVFISEMYSFLAQEDDDAEPFYRGLLGSGLSGSASGHGREWLPEAVYSEGTLSALPGRLVNGRDREWGMAY